MQATNEYLPLAPWWGFARYSGNAVGWQRYCYIRLVLRDLGNQRTQLLSSYLFGCNRNGGRVL